MKRSITLFIATAATVLATAGSAQATPRCGVLHVTKDCSEYNFQAGSFCTITSSNIRAIQPGSKVIYRKAVGDPKAGVLDSRLVIDGPGRNNAYGHVVLDAATLTGVVTIHGGTGRFAHFRAGPLAVACPAYPECTWDGRFHFTRHRAH